MAAQGTASPNPIDDIGKWVWTFLKNELTPYPGRAWVVARVTIAATIVMVLVMTFQIPNGFLGAIFTLFLSRENPTATFVAGLRTIAAFLVATDGVARLAFLPAGVEPPVGAVTALLGGPLFLVLLRRQLRASAS